LQLHRFAEYFLKKRSPAQQGTIHIEFGDEAPWPEPPVDALMS